MVTIELGAPGPPAERFEELARREAEIGARYREEGSLARMWRLPGRRASLSLWRVADADELHDLVSGFPLFPWMEVKVEALASHYLDPGTGDR